MQEFKRSEFIFKMDDEQYRVKHPTVKELEVFQKKNSEKEEMDIEGVVDFLEGLGLPKDVAYSMEPSHLNIVVDAISGNKKK